MESLQRRQAQLCSGAHLGPSCFPRHAPICIAAINHESICCQHDLAIKWCLCIVLQLLY